jgi:hypothetical protein
VSVVPAGVTTDLQVGDILLVYAATGAVMNSAESAVMLLQREIDKEVATLDFAVQRDGKMAVASISLLRPGQGESGATEQEGET